MRATNNNQNPPADAAGLRSRAEKRLERQRPEGEDLKTKADTARLIHELEVHQIELEMQNEELQQSRAETQALLAQYTDLYDFAPAGYITLDREGQIRQVNLAGARLLGVERSRLVKQRFIQYVAEADRRAFNDFLRRVFAGQTRESCEATLPQNGSNPVVVFIEGMQCSNGQECRMAVQDITARKQAEKAQHKHAEALRMSEQEFRSLAESMPQIVWATRPDGWTIYFNRQWVDYTGMTVEESYGHGWNKPFHPDDKQRAWDAWQRATQHNERYSLECRLRRRDGVYRWWLIRGEPMRGANGEILKWFGTCTDIEEIKNAEAALQERVAERTTALRESEERFRTMASAMPQLAWIANADGWIHWYNQRWYEYTGTTPEQMEGWGWQSVHDPVALPKVLEQWKASIASGEPFEMTFPLRGADGVFRSFLTRGFPLRDAAGRVTQWFGTNTDVTELKRAEESLAKQGGELQLILDSSPTMVFYKDRENHFLRVNQAFVKSMGRSKDELEGHSLFDLFPREQAEAFWKDDQEVMATARPKLDILEPMQTPAGLRWLETSKVPSLDAQGNVIGIIGFALDITARKQADEALRESEARLKRSEEIAHLGGWDLDLASNELKWSDEVYRIFGLQPQEFAATYEAFLDHVHPDDRAAVDAAYSGSVREGRDSYEIEHRIVRKDSGEIRWVHEKCQHVRDAGGKIVRSFGMVHDITDRKQAEEARRRAAAELKAANASLQESRRAAMNLMEDAVAAREQTEQAGAALRQAEERLRLATEAAELGTWEVDPGTGALDWSHRARVIFGVADNAPVNHQVFLDRLHPDDHERVLAARQRALDPAGDGRYEVEYRILWADGTVRWAIARGRAFFDTVKGERRAIRFIGTIRDVTTRKLADLALQHSRERFQLLSTVTARLLTAENPQTIVNELCEQVMAHLDCQAFFNFVVEKAPVEAVSDRHQTVVAVSDRREDADGESQSRRSETAATGGENDNSTDSRRRLRRSETAATGDGNGSAQGGRLRLNAYAGISAGEARKLEWLDYGVAVCGCAAQGGCRIVAEDVQHTPDPRTELVKGFGIQAYACHPLMTEGRLLGTLSFGTTRRTQFTDNDLAVMKTVADQVAVAMDRMRAAQALRRLNRALTALGKSDRAMLRAASEAEYLAEVCKIVVGDCGHAMVWVGFKEEDKARAVRPAACAGFEEGYLETLHVTWADTPRGCGPTGTAIRTGKPYVCADILTDPRFAPWREEAVRRGYASSVALPLTAAGRTFGALTIYAREPRAFEDQEVTLLGQLAGDLAYGIHVLRLRAANEEAVEAVRRSEERFRATFELAAVGIAQADAITGQLLRVNGKLCQITGYSASELAGKTFSDMTHPDDREAAWNAYQRFLNGETADCRVEKRLIRKDGSPVWVVVNVNLVRDAAGLPLRSVVAVDDISERKKFEHALQRAKDEWEKTFDSVPDLVAILDHEHRIVRANRAMAQRLGVEPRQCIGQVCHDFVHGMESPHASSPHSGTATDGGEHVVEVTESRLGGDFLISTTPVLDATKKMIGVVHVARDITARKKLENQLRELNAALEQRVRERTAELEGANRQLTLEVEKSDRAAVALQRANRALRVLGETNEALIRATDEEEFLRHACRILVSSGGYRLAWIGVAENNRKKTIRPLAEAGFEKGQLLALNPTWAASTLRGGRPSAATLRTGRITIARTTSPGPRFRLWKAEAKALGFGSAIALPLKSESGPMAVLTIAATETEAFDDGEVKLLTELAGNIAYAISTLRTRLERQQLQEEILTISEAEQRRFGQELHDGLCPQLVAIRFVNETLSKRRGRDTAPVASDAAKLTQMISATVDQARNIALMLNPVSLEADGLMAALEKLASDSTHIFKCSVRFICTQPVFVADNTVATHLYRIAQEAVRNGITHGKASRVLIVLNTRRDAIKLFIVNNGRHFPKTPPKTRGMGLKNMLYRAQAIGAQLVIRPRTSGGAVVTCALPARRVATPRKLS